jgi:tripeptide aminopeptidase
MSLPAIKHSVIDYFLKYVKYDTQSAEESEAYPSTEKQKILGAELVEDLKKIGLTDAGMDKYGYVTATLPATSAKKIPTIGLIAHMDTSPEVSGANVKPQIHKSYSGGKIVLPADTTQVLDPAENPAMIEQVGNDC